MDDAGALPVWACVVAAVLTIACLELISYLGRRYWDNSPRFYEIREDRWVEPEKGPNPKKRALAYEMISGYLGVEDVRIAEIRSQMDILVDVIYQHRMKLCARTGLDFEDKDLERIVSAYELMNQLCGDAMYDQGWLDAGYHPIEALKRWKTGPKT